MRSAEDDLRRSPDDGIGLIEIIVSMLLLALIAAAFLPVLATTVVQSARNVTTTSATQLVNDQLERARGVVSTCAAATSFLSDAPFNVVDLETGTTVKGMLPVRDSRKVEVQVTKQIGACPSAYPGTLRVTVKVIRTDTRESVTEATTFIYLEKAS